MADAYSAKANGWDLPSPFPTTHQKQTLKAFIDNVNLFVGQPPGTTEESFYALAQANINHWHGILQVTGGDLNTKKCFWSDFNLTYNKNGSPYVCQQLPTDLQLTISTSDGRQESLKSIKPHEGICHLGINISMDGNHKAEE